MRIEAHTLKGSAATVAAEGLYAIAKAIERAGSAGQLEHCSELMPRADEAFQQFKAALEETGWV